MMRVRELAPTDLSAVDALMAEAGFKRRSAAARAWLAAPTDHPAADAARAAPAGWVLEGEHGIDGYLGNIILPYALDGRPVVGATCADWFVRPAARASAVNLLRAFFRQPAAFHFSATANEASAPAYGLYKARAPIASSFRTSFLWIGDDGALLRAVARVPGARGLARLAGRARRRVGLAHPRTRGSVTLSTYLPSAIPDEVEAFWRARTAVGLHVARGSAAIRWMLADPDVSGARRVLVARDRRGVTGVAVVARHQARAHAFAQIRLLDLVLGEPTAAGPLLGAAVDLARAVGAAVVFAPGCGPSLAVALAAQRPHTRTRTFDAHYLRAGRGLDTGALLDAWHATGLDGDAPFALEDGAPRTTPG